MAGTQLYAKLAIIGAGLIGSSLARAARRAGAAGTIAVHDRDAAVRAETASLGFADAVCASLEEAVAGADLVVIATPVGAIADVIKALGPYLEAGATLSDVGSVKSPVAALAAELRADIAFIPAHPVAGTEHSGPAAGFGELFDGRWTILTPVEGRASKASRDRLEAFWQALGARVAVMDAAHHDRALAVTSHLPHLLAFTLVGTAADLEALGEEEIVKYAAGGFRDYTRIAASDPVMWRDIFLANTPAVLGVLDRFAEDLARLRTAIEAGDGEALFEAFARARLLRAKVHAAGQG